MDEMLSQWLVYLERRQSDIESNRRARIIPANAIGALFVGSGLYLASDGFWLLGIIGLLSASVLFCVLQIVNLRDASYLRAVEVVVKKILVGELTESAQVNNQLNEQVNSLVSQGFKGYVMGEIEFRERTKT